MIFYSIFIGRLSFNFDNCTLLNDKIRTSLKLNKISNGPITRVLQLDHLTNSLPQNTLENNGFLDRLVIRQT